LDKREHICTDGCYTVAVKSNLQCLSLILAGTLIAVFFRGLSSFIERKTKWNASLALAISVIVTLIFIIALFWLIGGKVQSQITQLSDTLPLTVENAKEQLNKSPLGQKLVESASSQKHRKRQNQLHQRFSKQPLAFWAMCMSLYF
jgi:predicted PurR-regulated permease PerM